MQQSYSKHKEAAKVIGNEAKKEAAKRTKEKNDGGCRGLSHVGTNIDMKAAPPLTCVIRDGKCTEGGASPELSRWTQNKSAEWPREHVKRSMAGTSLTTYSRLLLS